MECLCLGCKCVYRADTPLAHLGTITTISVHRFTAVHVSMYVIVK